MNVHEKRNAILGVEFDRYGHMLVIHTWSPLCGMSDSTKDELARVLRWRSGEDAW
jgi:extradiol dioxygenase family protein